MQSYFRVFKELVFFDLRIPIPDSGFPVLGPRVAQSVLRSRSVQNLADLAIKSSRGRALIRQWRKVFFFQRNVGESVTIMLLKFSFLMFDRYIF